MERDPLIDDVRKIRHAISAEHGHDIRKYIAHLQELESKLPKSNFYNPAKARKKQHSKAR